MTDLKNCPKCSVEGWNNRASPWISVETMPDDDS